MKIFCPFCRTVYEVDESYISVPVDCAACNNSFTIDPSLVVAEPEYAEVPAEPEYAEVPAEPEYAEVPAEPPVPVLHPITPPEVAQKKRITVSVPSEPQPQPLNFTSEEEDSVVEKLSAHKKKKRLVMISGIVLLLAVLAGGGYFLIDSWDDIDLTDLFDGGSKRSRSRSKSKSRSDSDSDSDSDSKSKKPEKKLSKFDQRIADDTAKGFKFSEDKKRLLKAPKDITEYEVPEGITCIGDSAFSACLNLVSISMPGSVTKVESGAFFGCSGLTNVKLSENLYTIGELAFCGCSKLRGLYIPSSVSSIGNMAFQGVKSLRLSEYNTSFVMENGWLMTSDKKTLIYLTPSGYY